MRKQESMDLMLYRIRIEAMLWALFLGFAGGLGSPVVVAWAFLWRYGHICGGMGYMCSIN